MGHFHKFCKSTTEIKQADKDRQTPNDDIKDIKDKTYHVNHFRTSTANLTAQNPKTHSNDGFYEEVIVNK